MPRRRPGEAVAVHWLRHAMFDAAGDDGAAGGGHGRFMDRFVSALHHYSWARRRSRVALPCRSPGLAPAAAPANFNLNQ
ncbi:hypothetical protein OsI_29364 [Oryza sativa Indica Group]|uniref:Uncharacterized protein n=1 Tax=Oryza sativa subsp. indica TaxID=39946 RepID=B8BB23_ORYSI|nr:hypothetical protein OsI_29364 [Oryza sativa Indica Group]